MEVVRLELELQSNQCKKEYFAKECDQAVEAIMMKCHELEMCFKIEASTKIKLTEIILRWLIRMGKELINQTG